MSTHKDKARHLAEEIGRVIGQQKHQGNGNNGEELPEQYQEVTENSSAILAILRNAEAAPEALANGFRTHLVSASGSVEKDGCDFIDFTLLFLDYLKCPEETRTLILAMAGMTGGNHSKFFIMTQDQIGRRLGVSRSEVANRIQNLITWEKTKDYTLVEIKENERDKETRKFLPTEYRIGAVYYAGEFIRRARSRNLYARNRQAAIEQSIDNDLQVVASEVEEEIPTRQILQTRKNVKNITPKSLQQQSLSSKKDQALRLIFECLDLALRLGVDQHTIWTELTERVTERMTNDEEVIF